MLPIGNEYPRFQFGLNINLAYKGFELSLSGSGMAQYDIYLNNSYYWMREDQKYSTFVKNYFNPSTGEGKFPRLTTQQNQNNYRSSLCGCVVETFQITRCNVELFITSEHNE